MIADIKAPGAPVISVAILETSPPTPAVAIVRLVDVLDSAVISMLPPDVADPAISEITDVSVRVKPIAGEMLPASPTMEVELIEMSLLSSLLIRMSFSAVS